MSVGDEAWSLQAERKGRNRYEQLFLVQSEATEVWAQRYGRVEEQLAPVPQDIKEASQWSIHWIRVLRNEKAIIERGISDILQMISVKLTEE